MKKKHLLLSGMLFGMTLFNNVSAQAINEGFEDITTLAAAGWVMNNLSTPIGTNPNWAQGTGTTPFAAYAGAGYALANYNNVAGANTISNWLITPNRTFTNGDVISFYTRTSTGAPYADRLQLRLSVNGTSTNVGTTNTSVGDFTTILLDINPTLVSGAGSYPDVWTQYSVTISGLASPMSGRAALRYFVTNGGPTGANSNIIGVDDFVYTPFGAPVVPDVTVTNPVRMYTSIPLSQVTAMPLTARTSNTGTGSTSDAMLTVKLYQLPDLVTPIQTTTSTTATIANGANLVQTAGTFTPTVVGDYVVNYISSCTGNTVTSADTARYSFSVSNKVYARDNGQIAGSFGIGAGPTGYLGAMYTIVNETKLDSVLVALNKAGTSAVIGDGVGDSTRVTVYSVSAGLPSTIIGRSPVYVFTPTDTLGVVVKTHKINAIGGGSLTLAPGTYFIAATEYQTNVGIAYSNDIFNTATYYAAWTGQAFTPVENFGAAFSKAMVIRPILLDCTNTTASTSTNVCYGSSYTYLDGLVVTNLTADESRIVTIPNSGGCDSLVTEMVVVDALVDYTVTASGSTLTSNETGATSYQWIDCGNGNAIIATATSQSYTATVTGSYAVIVTVGNCSDTSACQNASVIGINELDPLHIQLYPNPSNGLVKVTLKDKETVKYAILSIDGKKIIEGESTSNTFQVDLSGQSNGVYLLSVEQNSQKGTYRIVKE